MNICKYWYERDNDSGLYEYCKAANKKCTCSGDRNNCTFPEYLNSKGNEMTNSKPFMNTRSNRRYVGSSLFGNEIKNERSAATLIEHYRNWKVYKEDYNKFVGVEDGNGEEVKGESLRVVENKIDDYIEEED